ncbi:alpha/beta hydrolase [Microbaculum marinum]|uniref:Alpha/beta hydrolase n=1 Tax=Microbaculum marinum TaxID=1764581 RepID=A0AAW9RLC6_9HYPH
MRHFKSDGVDIAYIDEGSADEPPILLIHGFASNVEVNWVSTGWVDALRKDGRRVVAFDNRGHGQSEKLYGLSNYGAPLMAEDARRLLDHLSIDRADVMGYSMGARITAFLAVNHPARVRSAIFGGLGIRMVTGVGSPEPIAAALEAPALEDVKDPVGRAFRSFAEQTGSDRKALATCLRSARAKITPEVLAMLHMPILVAVGTDDPVAGTPDDLVDLIPNARAFHIEGRDHMKAVGDRTYKAAVLEFLKEDA